MNTTTHKEKFYWKQWVPIALILLLATGLYLYDLGEESLWRDELISIHRAKNLKYFFFLVPRPLYPTLLNGWMMFGDSDIWLRGLCVIFTLGSVFLIYQLGCRLVSKPVGLISALILTLSPLFINHAQEVRMYGPSTFFGLLGTLALASALESPNKFSIGGWVIARWLAIISTPLNLLLLLPDTVLFAWKFRKQKRLLLSFGIGLIVIFLLWSPWLINVARDSSVFVGGIRQVETVDPNLARKFKHPGPDIFKVLFQVTKFTTWYHARRPASNLIYGFYIFYSVITVSLIGLAIFEKRNVQKVGWAAAWGFLPLIPIFLFSHISRSLWVNRYLMFTAPYIFIILAVGFLAVWRRWKIGAVAIALIYFVAVGGVLKRYYTTQSRGNWRDVFQLIQTNEQPGDLFVWVGGWRIDIAIEHYYRGSANIVHKNLSDLEDPQALESWIQSLPQTPSRIWLLLDLSPSVLSAIEKQFEIQIKQQQHETSDQADVLLVVPRKKYYERKDLESYKK
ncbi:MAG: hypothetical protein F6K23_25925 [Okeania sp. SIO2C9]|uniref:glycosyltransferase family 39 protein n=1 Tax=Okeania sp. SIO2C9 TaxID=2607791 RepID=UPI0013C16AF8|nr:glycosyltransferase family 39 protein [Okeania sp. SIO2C9]NEQ76174.1 hypothetical protein [Okeania sp. SIO2C9]